MLPEILINKIILYNSTVLRDLFKSRLKSNKLMILFKWPNGNYIRLWHYMQEIPACARRWSANIDGRILRKKGYYNG